jgi:hypothetical protein
VSDPVAKAIDVLNDALARDPESITELVNMRIPCNKALSDHPTIHTTVIDREFRVGVLGLLNGALGNSPSGVIGAEGQTSDAGKFVKVRRFVDLRLTKLDVLT